MNEFKKDTLSNNFLIFIFLFFLLDICKIVNKIMEFVLKKSEHSIGPVYLLSKEFEKSGEAMYGIPV